MTTPFVDATSGALGSAFANALIFPLDVVKTKLQVQNKIVKTTDYKGALDAIKSIYLSKGIEGLYAGFIPSIAGNILNAFSYFFIYSTVRAQYIKKNSPSTAAELFIGAVSGALCQLIVLPINVITTRNQTSTDNPSVTDIVRDIIIEEGPQGLWKGLQASLVLCVNPAITYGMFEKLKALSNKPTVWTIFWIGALSKALATIVTYPYIMAKIRMQWKPNTKTLSKEQIENTTYKSPKDVLVKIYQSEGVYGWYRGMSTQIVKAVFCQAVLFVSKEKVTAYVILIIAILKRRFIKRLGWRAD